MFFLLLIALFFGMSQNYPLEVKPLFQPPLEELADLLNKELKKNFREVSVKVVDCPDLTQQPFTLAAKGLNGNAKLVEIGGPPYLLPLVQRDKVYDLKDIASLLKIQKALIIGAGAGPHVYVGRNCEGVYNLFLNGSELNQQSRISKVDENDDLSIQEILPGTESRIALLGNLLFSDGEGGKVLEVYAKTRIGEENYIESIRKILEKHYEDKLIGLGGTFLLKQGKAKQHVMRDFSKTPIVTEEQLNNWLKFYNMSAPLIAVGTLVNKEDKDLDLRVQHFHSFSHHNEAGHYHIDTTPQEAEYLGYFTTAGSIHRIDKPIITHQIGRD